MATESGTSQEIAWPAYRLTQRRVDELPEYSASIPTGTTIGKKWKRDANWHDRRDVLHGCVAHLDFWSGALVPMFRSLVPIPAEVRALAKPRWVMGEYVDIGSKTEVGIRWTPIEIVPDAEEHRRR